MTRTRVPRWTPPLGQAFRLAWRPALAYLLFTALGSLALFGTILYYERSSKDVFLFMAGLTAGLVGVVLGQLIAILRARTLPVFVVGGACVFVAVMFISMARPPGGEYLAVPLVFFCFAFPCGLLSLQHRWELLASFWPAVGWIGGVFVILNEENRIVAWEEEKVAAWLPVPLVYLGCFLVLWLLYLASKQAVRVELWQTLSGAAARRVSKAQTKARVSALPKKNLLPMLFVALLLFGATAVLAPYLWRTGKGDRDSQKPHDGRVDDEPRRTPDFDGEGLVKQLQQMANAAKETLPKLWPLLLLLLLYRPAKRALLTTHLRAPLVPTPPSERIDNLWEYVRIAAEDAGVVPAPSDSVEQLLARMQASGRGGPDLARAAEIYVRTRYGFTVARGDAVAMRAHAEAAARALRKDLGTWGRVKNLWRPLS